MTRIVLDLTKIHSRCEPDGDCLVWQGAATGANGRVGAPSAQHDGKVTNVRRLVYALTHERPAGSRLVTVICGNPLCLEPDHLVALTRAAAVKAQTKAGAFKAPSVTAAKVAANRKRSTIKSMAVAREIRESTESAADLAVRHGTKQHNIWKIRSGKGWVEHSLSQSSVFALGQA